MRPTAEILTIGNELLKGSVLNTNAKFLGRELTSLGFEVTEQSACRDEMREIMQSVGRCFRRADLLILCGGLGPTPDDLTRDAVAAYFRVPLKLSNRQYTFIRNYYRKRKRTVPEIVKKEAMFPANSHPLFNKVGIALGFYIFQDGKLMVVLPGVPVELEKMFVALVKPLIHQCFKRLPKRERLIVKTVGLSEPGVMMKLGRDFFSEPFDFGIYPETGEVTLRLYAESPPIIRRLALKVRKRLGKSVYATEEKSLSQALGEILRKKRKSVAVAESCTGGLLASQFTQVPGAGKYFRGSVTVYQIQVKRWLGVKKEVIKDNGVVSAETARELAKTIRSNFKTDYGIGVTGVAGPKAEGGPIGLVYIAVAGAKKVKVWKENFLGERDQIQAKAAKKALEHLWRWIREG
jgi:nicotinamide-nucleotide amidase